MTHRFRTMPTRSTTAAGYGNTHMRARKAAAARHQPTDPCTRCQHPLGPMGPWLHYDHTDDRTSYDRDTGTITITADNGTWRYRVARFTDDRTVEAHLLP